MISHKNARLMLVRRLELVQDPTARGLSGCKASIPRGEIAPTARKSLTRVWPWVCTH